MKHQLFCALLLPGILACNRPKPEPIQTIEVNTDTFRDHVVDILVPDNPDAPYLNTGVIQPEEVVAFAKTLKGIPYAYACSSPSQGFDCSGFINYVFDHFNIDVPRSSVDFTNVGKEVLLDKAKPGDLILFTGTDSNVRRVGHIGIVIHNASDSLSFIHSSSGSANGVTVTPLNEYYKGRFVKISRIFPQNQDDTAEK